MVLQSEIIVSQDIDTVSKFFFEPSNLSKWDRSVARVMVTSSSKVAAGSEFETIAPSGILTKGLCRGILNILRQH